MMGPLTPEQEKTENLYHENFSRWQWFYKKGMISRRTFVQAISVWSGVAGAMAAGAMPGAAAPLEPQPSAMSARSGRQGKDSIVHIFDTDVPNLDPHMHNARVGIILYYHLFDNLGVRDMQTMRIGPHLATSWEIVNPTTWEMRLRQDVKFHNGDDFTAETVKWNWERIANPDQKSPQRGNHSAVEGVDILDRHTIRVRTKAPYPIFTERLQNFQFLSEKLAKEKGDAWLGENPVGTGPYKFVEWKRGQSIQMVRNDDYWGPKAHFANYTYRVVADPATALAELLSGSADIIRVVPFDQVPTVNASGRARAAIQRILRVGFVVLDAKGRTGANPFQDVRVRHAANHAINVPLYIERLQAGGDRTPALVNPMHLGFDPSVQPHEYDPDKARALLKDAGYADGFEARWLRGPSLMPNQNQVDQAMQRDLQRVGIRTNFQTYDDGVALNNLILEGKGGPMYNTSWGSYSVFDADGIYFDMLHRDSIFAYYDNEPLSKLLEDGRATIDNDARIKIYAEAQKMVREDAPVLFMWGFHNIWGVTNDIDWGPSPDEIDRVFNAKPK